MPTDVFGPHSYPPDPKKLRLFDVSKSQFVTSTGEPAERKGDDALLFERSDCVHCNSRLVSFLYELMRDHLSPGVVERLVRSALPGDTTYTNGWLAKYASDLAARLDPPAPEPTYEPESKVDGSWFWWCRATIGDAPYFLPADLYDRLEGFLGEAGQLTGQLGRRYPTRDSALDALRRAQEASRMSEAHVNHPPAPVCCVKGCSLPGAAHYGGKPYCGDHRDAGAREFENRVVEDQVRVEGGWPKETEIAGPVTLVDKPLSPSERAMAEMQRDGDAEYLKAIGGPTIGFSIETLVRYRCGWCAAFWAIGGGPTAGSLYCPKCGKPSQLLEGLPLPVKPL